MKWTAEQYVRRVLVEVATRTGRSVAEVVQQPFALSLWTWAELREIDREATVTRLGERLDAAGMTAMAFHDPPSLQKQELRYYRQAGLLGKMMDDARERAARVHAAASRGTVRTGA